MRERPVAEAGHENDDAEDEQRLLEGECNETIYHEKILQKISDGASYFDCLKKTLTNPSLFALSCL
jgi:hypothetical protein